MQTSEQNLSNPTSNTRSKKKRRRSWLENNLPPLMPIKFDVDTSPVLATTPQLESTSAVTDVSAGFVVASPSRNPENGHPTEGDEASLNRLLTEGLLDGQTESRLCSTDPLNVVLNGSRIQGYPGQTQASSNGIHHVHETGNRSQTGSSTWEAASTGEFWWNDNLEDVDSSVKENALSLNMIIENEVNRAVSLCQEQLQQSMSFQQEPVCPTHSSSPPQPSPPPTETESTCLPPPRAQETLSVDVKEECFEEAEICLEDKDEQTESFVVVPKDDVPKPKLLSPGQGQFRCRGCSFRALRLHDLTLHHKTMDFGLDESRSQSTLSDGKIRTQKCFSCARCGKKLRSRCGFNRHVARHEHDAVYNATQPTGNRCRICRWKVQVRKFTAHKFFVHNQMDKEMYAESDKYIQDWRDWFQGK